MSKILMILIVLAANLALFGTVMQKHEEDVVPTLIGDLKIVFVGHASLFFIVGDKIVHVDPVMAEGDYSKFPKADLILVTHDHYDHLDPEAIGLLRKEETQIVAAPSCSGKINGALILKNGDKQKVQGFEIEAVPAYNIVNKRSDGNPFHPKGLGNGYVIAFGDTRVYVAGDTENTPEMMALGNIDIAFLPMNLPYTMTPGMVAEAARAIRPKILYPYHFGDTDTNEILKLLENEKDIDVRIRPMN